MLIKPYDPVTALTLLDCFDAVCPKDVGAGLWEETDTRHWPASLYRLQQLKSLFRAFEIKFDPARFANGGFTADKRGQHQALIDRLSRRLTDEQRRRSSTMGLIILFEWLRKYRREVLQAKDSYNVFLCYPPIVHGFMSEIVDPVADAIANILSPINHILSELIDPSRRTFRLEELVVRYGHPTGDYAEMRFKETDWWSLVEEDLNDSET